MIANLTPFHVIREEVPCPWEAKGAVMRRLNEHNQHDQVETTDGVKIRLNETEWVLILPDPDRPIFQIYAESASPAQATALAQKYAALVNELRE